SFSDIIGVQNDIRVIATELEHGLLQILSGMGRDDFTGTLRTRQGYALYAIIGDNLFDLIMCCKKVGVDPFRSARIIKKFLDSECRSGTNFCVLEQNGIAQHQVWSDKSRYLVVREVPRHNTKQRAQWQAANNGLAVRIGRNFLIGGKLRAVVGVVL